MSVSQEELDDAILEIEDLRDKIAEKDKQIEELTDKLDQLKEDQADKERDTENAITLKRQFEIDLASRDQEILQLKANLRSTQNENDSLKDKLQAAKSEAKKA